MKIKLALRLLYFNYIFWRHHLDDYLWQVYWLRPLIILSYINPMRWQRKTNRAENLRLALEDLGPLFVKLGQVLSTRRDLLAEDIALELAKLQDNVPPFSGKKAIKIIEKVFKKPISECFASFDKIPLASASIAQVHAATLLSGEKVVVKVLRPQIKKIIKRDIILMQLLVKTFERLFQKARYLSLQEAITEFKNHLFDECDFVIEASNACQLKRNFAQCRQIHVPKIYWQFTKEQVMVSEHIYGIPVSDLATLEAEKFDKQKIAKALVDLFFTQVFRDSFFHADFHPGNIFISKTAYPSVQFILVDFGIMGALSTHDQRYLASNLLAFFKRDYRRVSELHIESGWVPPSTRVDAFESAIRAVCEPVFERPLNEISFADVFMRLLQTSRRFEMKIQPQLILLQKTLVNVEGLGRMLYPELDLFSTAKPTLEKWIKGKMGVKSFVKELASRVPYWTEKLPEIPDLIYQQLNKKEKLHDESVQVIKQLTHENKKIKIGLIISFVLIAVILAKQYLV